MFFSISKRVKSGKTGTHPSIIRQDTNGVIVLFAENVKQGEIEKMLNSSSN